MSDSDSDSEQLGVLQQHDEDWEDWAGGDEDGEEDDATPSLFSPTVLPSPEAALAHDAAQHGFDLRHYRAERSLDDYETIKLVNFIRSEVAAGRDPRPALAAAPKAAAAAAAADAAAVPWSSDSYLQPVLPDDPLLTYDYDEGAADDLAAAMAALPAAGAAAAGGGSSGSSDPAAVAALQAQLAAARAENRELLLRVAALMEAALPAELQAELREAAAEGGVVPDWAAQSSSSQAGPSSSSRPSPPPPAAAAAAAAAAGATAAAAGATAAAAVAGATAAAAAGASSASLRGVVGGSHLARRVDAAYFDSYSYSDIHHEMLCDKPRTLAYQAALLHNPSLLRGAAVLDVGCGTSILSLFAAKGGAQKVVGLDGSERIAGFARQIVAANQLDSSSGGPISIISGKVEEAPDIGVDKVSVIVSEWMGYALLFESMLDSVLAARDRWLAPGGAVLPDRASIWVAGADETAFGTAFWKDVYGFNMAPVASELASSAAAEAKVLVKAVADSAINTTRQQVHAMDLATMTADQQDFTATFELTAAAAAAAPGSSSSSSDSSSSSVSVAALVMWFDVEFSERFCKDHPVTLSTSPSAEVTHWAHAVLPLQQPIKLAAAAAGDSSSSSSSSGGLPRSVQCRLSMARSRSKHRSLDISLEVGGQARVYTMEVTGGD